MFVSAFATVCRQEVVDMIKMPVQYLVDLHKYVDECEGELMSLRHNGQDSTVIKPFGN